MNAANDDAMQRIVQLEELAAHQSRVIDELSAELASQWTVIDQLQKRFERLVDRFTALEQSNLEAPAITRPPHY